MALTWTIQDGTTFTDGTSLTGSWDFDDAGAGTYSALSLVTMELVPFEGAGYSNLDSLSFSGDANGLIASTPSIAGRGIYTLTIDLATAMTNAGGAIVIDLLLEERKADTGELLFERRGTAGLVSAPAVVGLAEPATLGLLVFGLAGISLVRRRRAT
jgi:hypothetical protein